MLYILFYIGERISLKDDNPVYTLGNLQESSLVSLQKNSNKALVNLYDYRISLITL